MQIAEYGGLIETMYSQFSERELSTFPEGEKIKKYKERIDELFLSENLNELKEKLLKFTEKDRNYLNSPLLDNFLETYNKQNFFEESLQKDVNYFILILYLKFTEKTSALNLSCKYGNLPIVVHIAEAHAFNESPFLYAAEYGHLNVIKYLKTKYTHFQLMNCTLASAVGRAVSRGHLHIVKYFAEECEFNVNSLIGTIVIDYAKFHRKHDIENYLQSLRS